MAGKDRKVDVIDRDLLLVHGPCSQNFLGEISDADFSTTADSWLINVFRVSRGLPP